MEFLMYKDKEEKVNNTSHIQLYIIRSNNIDMRTTKGKCIKELYEFLHARQVDNTPRLKMRIPEL